MFLHVFTEAHLTVHLLTARHPTLAQHLEERNLLCLGINSQRHDSPREGSTLQRVLTIEDAMVELRPVGVEESVWNLTLVKLRRKFRHDIIVEDRTYDDGIRMGIEQALTFKLEGFGIKRVVTEYLKGNLEVVEASHTIGQPLLHSCPITIDLMHRQNGGELMHAVGC